MALSLLAVVVLQVTVLRALLFPLSRYSLHLAFMTIVTSGQRVLVASTLVVLKAVDRKTLADIGMKGTVKGLGYGLALGSVSIDRRVRNPYRDPWRGTSYSMAPAGVHPLLAPGTSTVCPSGLG